MESSARQRNKVGCNPAERGVAPAFWRQGLDGTFSAEAWSCFAKEYWERGPLLIPQTLTQPLASEAEIFRASVEAGAHFRATDDDRGLSFYVEHARQVASIGDYLPQASDGSLARYAERVSRRLEGRRFGLVLEDIQVYAPTMWWQCRAFLRGLDAAVPGAGANRKATAFIGNYAMTPSGLHRGTSGNFKFVVSGRKRMRLWPDQFFRGRKGVDHTVHIEPFLPAATTLEGGPGDVLYWPSDQWHVGEALGGLCVSVSLAIFVQTRPPSNGDGSERAIAQRLNHASGGGFLRVPAPLPSRQIKAEEFVRSDARYPVFWEPGRAGEIVCSANGHAFAVKAERALIELLEQLNRGGKFRVSDLVGGRPALRRLLEKLRQLRAIS